MKTPWATTPSTTRTWSPQQQAVFAWFRAATGNLVVRARAGTGKTTTILHAITHVPGSPRILLAAFNKRIQTELGDKLEDDRAEAKTLHALGFAQLRRVWPSVKIDDQVDEERIVEANGGPVLGAVLPLVRKLVSLLKGCRPFGGVEDAEELAINYACEPENGSVAQGWDTRRVAELAVRARDKAQTKDPQGRITFDDMLYVPLACKMTRPTYDWVIVDEAQDMNVSQLLLARAVCRPGGHIVVVGDDCQAIYGFRGADSGSIDRLKGELGATELSLTTTYRCPKTVVAVAQTLVGDFQAAPEAPEGHLASMPAPMLPTWVGPGDAILSRINAPLVSLCLGFIRAGVPARIEGRDIGKTLATLVKKMHARSVPEFLSALASYKRKQVERITALGKNLEQRLGELEDKVETLAALAEGCKGMPEILDRCEHMFGDSQNGAQRSAQVVLSSIHKAKGLEWTKVFLLEGTLYCNGRRMDQEERNIHYVAVTRAKESLVMVRKEG